MARVSAKATRGDQVAQRRALLLIADIGGYTAFVRAHQTSLAHAQDIVGRLLEAMVDAARGLKVVEIEGDGVFFVGAPPDSASASTAVVDRVAAMYRAFHARQRRTVALNACPCLGCREAGELRVKFVGHVGEVVEQRVKRTVKPSGLDVILVHRMLKNAVPLPEYFLVSDALLERTDARVRGRSRELLQEFEGLGRVRTHFVDARELAGTLPPDPPVTRSAQFLETWGVVIRTLPYRVGLRRPHFAVW
jgi:hypothetical protein